tara:strand:+ start:1041 stop:1496 length:456 start_codon:yes stop_codon:yes gene_type:complete
MANSADNQEELVGNVTNLITSLATLAKLIKGIFTPSTPLPPITKAELAMGMTFREGLSAMDIASEIMDKQSKLGLNIGPQRSGRENMSVKMEAIRVQTMHKYLTEKAVIRTRIPLNAINVQLNGTAGPYPVVGTGTNSQPYMDGYSEGIIT